MTPIILASTSPYRAELLGRLGLSFETVSPGVDETSFKASNGRELASALAREKAQAVAQSNPGCIVIGSDQVAVCDGRFLGKPGSTEAAIEQLLFQRGKATLFETAVCVLDEQGVSNLECVLTLVQWLDTKQLTDELITNYVHREQPLDCAGAAKSEALGVTLISQMRSDDPTALVGLPLIALTKLLRNAGIEPLSKP
ncbi:MAG: Maf family nucleotide pyrophosphatase [Bordetella sp.]|jgi:septum formation protein